MDREAGDHGVGIQTAGFAAPRDFLSEGQADTFDEPVGHAVQLPQFKIVCPGQFAAGGSQKGGLDRKGNHVDRITRAAVRNSLCGHDCNVSSVNAPGNKARTLFEFESDGAEMNEDHVVEPDHVSGFQGRHPLMLEVIAAPSERRAAQDGRQPHRPELADGTIKYHFSSQ